MYSAKTKNWVKLTFCRWKCCGVINLKVPESSKKFYKNSANKKKIYFIDNEKAFQEILPILLNHDSVKSLHTFSSASCCLSPSNLLSNFSNSSTSLGHDSYSCSLSSNNSLSLTTSTYENNSSIPEICVDLEGEYYGRFGRLSLIQIANRQNVFVFDCTKEKNYIIDFLSHVLSSSNCLKIMHDCREDSSILYNQFNIKLQNVYDTQVAYSMLCEIKANTPYQISLNDLLFKTLNIWNGNKTFLQAKMSQNFSFWKKRPLSKEMIEYAVREVVHLAALKEKLCEDLKDLEGKNVVKRSESYVNYCHLNEHIKHPGDFDQKGLIIQAMLASSSPTCMYFKLNCNRSGILTNKQALINCNSVKIGEIIDAVVTSVRTKDYCVFLERINK